MRLLFITVVFAIVSACATQESYVDTTDLEEYALIDDGWTKTPTFGLPEGTWILSIDRVEIEPDYLREKISPATLEKFDNVYESDINAPIVISTGLHKVLIRACQRSAIPVGYTSVLWNCAETVVRIEAEAFGFYKIKTNVSTDKNHADVWIEDLTNETRLTEPQRIKGLSKQVF